MSECPIGSDWHPTVEALDAARLVPLERADFLEAASMDQQCERGTWPHLRALLFIGGVRAGDRVAVPAWWVYAAEIALNTRPDWPSEIRALAYTPVVKVFPAEAT